jgi:hypothetical protein
LAVREFEAIVEADGEGGAWPIIRIPFDAAEVFGSKARLAIAGTLNGIPYRSSIFPSGGGKHVLMLNKEMRKAAGIGVGDTVKVTMDADSAPREVETPADLQAALEAAGQLAAFEKMSYSNRKFCIDAIVGAKKPETRASRIDKAVETVKQGKKFM